MTAVTPETTRSEPFAAPAPGPVRQGLKDTAAFAVALVPFGLALGSASVAAGLSLAQAMFGALIMLAGAAQLAVVESLGRGDGAVAAVVITALINLRFVYYGAGAARWFAGAPLWRRLLLVYPLVDQNFLLGQQRFGADVDLRWRQRYYLAATALLAGAFVGSQLVAFQLGAALPPELGLHLAAPLVFAGMLARNLDGAPARIAAVVAASAVVLGAGWLGPATLPVAVALGVAVAARRWSR
jgi:branched chain amino acid efflux pump